MKAKRWFPIVYMFVVTAFFSAVVIGFSQLTEKRVKTNEARAFELAVLKVLPGLYDPNAGAVELHWRFVEQLEPPTVDSARAYTLKQNGQVVAYALPFTGQGFWAPIDGVIGIKADRQTITGIAFYEQNETPGLGAQITTSAFTSQFQGKVISSSDKPLNVRRPGDALGKSDLHAVTGATQTSIRLEKILNDALKKWRAGLAEKAREIQ